MAKGSRLAACKLEPLVGHDHHGLRQVERSEGRIDRQGDDAVGQRHLVVLEPIALAAEQDRDGFACRNARRHQRRRLRRADDRLGLVMGARGGGENERTVGNGAFERVVKRSAIEDAVGAGRHHARLVVRPGLPRPHQPQPRQAEIRHGAGHGADILAKLRLDQDHDRAGAFAPMLGLVGSCPGHCSSASGIANSPEKRQRIAPNVGFLRLPTDAIGRAPNSRQSNSRLAMSAPRTIHLRARGRNHSTAPANVQFPVGPNKHGDQRCKHARSRNHVDKGR